MRGLPIPDIEERQPDDERQGRDRDEQQYLEHPFFVFQVHEEPEHEARLDRSDCERRERAEPAQVQARDRDGDRGQDDERDPDV